MTCEDGEDVKKFPQLPEDIQISGRVGQSDAIDYIEKVKN